MTDTKIGYLCENDAVLKQGIEELSDKVGNRMDALDENDEKLRQGINESHRVLEEKLNEEHRLRIASDEEIAKLNNDNTELWERVTDMKVENDRFANQNLKLGIIAGVCTGVVIVMGCIVIAGLI